MLFSMPKDENHQPNNGDPDIPTISALVPSQSAPCMLSQQAQLDQESHQNRLALENKIKQEKTTAATYKRLLKKYEAWWKEDQSRRVSEATKTGSAWIAEDPHPITALKAAIYLNYFANRPKLNSDGSEMEGTRPGPSAVKQCTNALEYYRLHLQHEDRYHQCPESHRPLRDDIRIKQIEAGAAATDAERILHIQARKARGEKSETFTPTQLTDASLYYLKPERGKTSTQIETLLRDRSMLLCTTAMAFRGDNIRRIKWSDICICQTLLPDIGPEFYAPTIVIVTNCGKENSSGRLDEHGAFRHRLPEHCAIGALALHYFGVFHVSGKKIPDFLPNFLLSSENGIGFRDWYERLVYPGKDKYVAMSLDNHTKRVNKMKDKTGIDISKVTHAGRGYTVKIAREGGASVEGAMALGTWMASAGGSFAPAYDRALPVDAMLGAAGFNANRQQSYFVARAILDPPPELLSQVFPWIEAETIAYHGRLKAFGDKAHDSALLDFFSLLQWFRVVLLQDAAILFSKHPELSIFQYQPFNGPRFHDFSLDAVTVISDAEVKAELNLKNLPDAAAEAMRGMFTAASMKQEVVHHQVKMTHSRMDQTITDMKTLLEAALLSGLPSKKRKALEAALSTPPTRPSPAPPISRNPSKPTENQLPNSLSTSNISAESASNEISVHSPVDLPSLLAIDTTPTDSSTIDAIPPTELTGCKAAASPIQTRTVSRTGNIYGYSTFPLSDDFSLRSKQHDALSALEGIFSYERLSKHEFDWDTKVEEWIPKFLRFWTPPGNQKLTIEDVWRENKFGIDGHLSIQELNARWDARWRRNQKPLKTEYSRRNKIVILIERLCAKPNWNTELAFRFLHEKFAPQTISSRTLSDFLIPQEKMTVQILDSAASYP